MILKNNGISDFVPEKVRAKKPINYDAYITMRVDRETLDEFRNIVGEPYQPVIRDLMVQYINRYKYTYTKEEERKKRINARK